MTWSRHYRSDRASAWPSRPHRLASPSHAGLKTESRSACRRTSWSRFNVGLTNGDVKRHYSRATDCSRTPMAIGLSVLSSPWSAGGVPNMHYSHPIIEQAIEHFEWIANKRHHMQTRPLFDLGRAERLSADALGYGADARFQSFGHPVAEYPAAVSRNLAKVRDSSARILNLHRRRNVRNAASTSSSVATPLCSASSIA